MRHKLFEMVANANTGADAIKRAPIVSENTGLRCLRIGDVSQGRPFSEWGFTKTTDDDFNKYQLKAGDTIIARTGNTIGVNTYIDAELQSVYNNGLIRIQVNQDVIHPRYFYYLVRSKGCQDFIQSIAFGTSTQPNMKIKDFLQYEFEYFDKDVQDKIIRIIDPIEEKIKLNNEINSNLEQQAQAIFDKYLNLSELPSGWVSSNLLDIADYLNGLAMQKYRPSDDETGLPVLKIKELRQGCCDSNSELCSKNINTNYIIDDGDVIFSWSGSLLVDFWCGGKCGLNQHLFKVSSTKYDKWFYYAWTKHHLNRFIAIASDMATTMGHIKREELSKATVFIPPDEEYNHIGSLLAPIYNAIIWNRLENNHLASIRDTLLPKLMSGEIDLSNIDI